MFGVDDMLIGAAISGVGSMATNWFNTQNVEKTNAANAQQAQLNRDFQERMSNTAYQRGMADMKAAGLNPILAYQKGGASAPSGAQATMIAPKIEGNPAAEAVHSGQSLMRNRLEFANLYQQNKNLQAQEHQTDADAALKAANTLESAARTKNLASAYDVSAPDRARAKADAELLENSAMQTVRKTGTAAEEGARITDPVLGSAGRLISSALGVKKLGTRRSTEELTRSDGTGQFKERFHY